MMRTVPVVSNCLFIMDCLMLLDSGHCSRWKGDFFEVGIMAQQLGPYLWCWLPIWAPGWVLAVRLSVQASAMTHGKSEENGPSLWLQATFPGDPGFWFWPRPALSCVGYLRTGPMDGRSLSLAFFLLLSLYLSRQLILFSFFKKRGCVLE